MTALEEGTNRALQLAAAFERSGDIRLLDRPIDLFAEVVAADDDTGPERARYLDNLGVALLTRFEARQDRAALARALMYSRRAAIMAGPGQHPDHALHLSNSSNTALAWFEETRRGIRARRSCRLDRRSRTGQLARWPDVGLDAFTGAGHAGWPLRGSVVSPSAVATPHPAVSSPPSPTTTTVLLRDPLRWRRAG